MNIYFFSFLFMEIRSAASIAIAEITAFMNIPPLNLLNDSIPRKRKYITINVAINNKIKMVVFFMDYINAFEVLPLLNRYLLLLPILQKLLH